MNQATFHSSVSLCLSMTDGTSTSTVKVNNIKWHHVYTDTTYVMTVKMDGKETCCNHTRICVGTFAESWMQMMTLPNFEWPATTANTISATVARWCMVSAGLSSPSSNTHHSTT